MIENSSNQDKIFENTNIASLTKKYNGYIATTSFGEKIYCEKVLIATGFNWEILKCDDLCQRFITYTIATQPIKDFSWHNKTLIHDATSPYHYLRLLQDNRIIFDGEDTPFKMKPISEKDSYKVYEKLEKSLYELFPDLENKIKIDYKFCGAFGTTLNNLGLIGESAIDKNLLLFISCGANGIINAMAGAKVIDDIISGKPNKLIKLFSPKR